MKAFFVTVVVCGVYLTIPEAVAQSRRAQGPSETQTDAQKVDSLDQEIPGDVGGKKKKKKKSKGQVTTGMSFGTSKTEYARDDGLEFALDRKVLGFSLGHHLGANKIGIEGHVGRIIRTELVDDKDLKGDGYSFGARVNKFYGMEDFTFVPFVRFNYLAEELIIESTTGGAKEELKDEIDIYEFVLGGDFFIYSGDNFRTFLGLELFPIHEGESKVTLRGKKVGGTATSTDSGTAILLNTQDFERDDIMNLNIGRRCPIRRS